MLKFNLSTGYGIWLYTIEPSTGKIAKFEYSISTQLCLSLFFCDVKSIFEK